MKPGYEPLTESQAHLLSKFYEKPLSQVRLDKSQRKRIWDDFKVHRSIENIQKIAELSPAMIHVLNQAILKDLNLQSAILSECVFAEYLSRNFNLNQFYVFEESKEFISSEILELLDSKQVVPRYFYTNNEFTEILFQAGGHLGVDAALVIPQDRQIFAIEFKESYAKSSEPDLPPFTEDGYIVLSQDFKDDYPQFVSMLQEQLTLRLNFFAHMGTNVNEFSASAILQAVDENYVGAKFADVIVTENDWGTVVMIPVNHASMWARLEGEIRTAGRNHYKAWTPLALENFLIKSGANISNNLVRIPASALTDRTARGGAGKVTGKKINPLFFIRMKDVVFENGIASFDLDKVRQIRPTISAKMDFKKIDVEQIREFYMGIINS